MERNLHHEALVKGVSKQLKPIFEKSDQAIYVYLDDVHKTCNKKFAELLGYGSVKEWVENEAPLSDVLEDDQTKVITAYKKAVEKMVGSNVEVRLRNIKTEKVIKANMILVPITYEGHVFALHFINKI